VTERARGLIERYGLSEGQQVPADIMTTSGSGMDPHITIDSARFQAHRVAAARGLPANLVEELIAQSNEVPTLRAFGGEQVVNVLKLNIALDAVHSEVQ
jgi:K+-transporting ATPase ATPase C chain